MIRRAIIVGCLLLGAAWLLSAVSHYKQVPPRSAFAEFPGRIGPWTSDQPIELDEKVLRILGVDDYVNRVYLGSDDSSVGLYVGFYRSQEQGSSIHSPLNCLPGAGWDPIQTNMVEIFVESYSTDTTSPRQRSIKVNQLLIQKGVFRQIVLYWYQSHGRIIASEYMGKLYAVIDAVRTHRTDAALVRVICPIAGEGNLALKHATDKATDFTRRMFPLLGQYLPE